jgi:PAS domain S-box-containing protein
MVRLYDHKDHDAGCPFSQLSSISEIALTRIQNMDTIFGLLIVTKDKGQTFLEEDIELLSIIANHISVAFKAIRTLEKSQKNELKYSQLVKTINSGVAVYRTENDGETFIFEDINPSGQRICHMNREELVGKDVVEVFPGIIESGLLDAFRGVYKTHQSVLVPTTLYKDKELSLWVENRVYALSDGRIAAVFEDKTNDKKDEWEKDMLVQAIEQANETVVITDTKGDIFYVNAAFEKTTGYTRREAYGCNTRILKSGKHDEFFYRNLWATISSGKIWKGRMINKRKDGGIFVEEASISPIFDELGLIVNYVAVKMDITDNLNLIEDKSKLEKTLQQSQKLESIGRLAGGVAHDFNNMLSVILGYGSSILKELRKEDPLYESMTQVINAAKKSVALTRQLLAFSRKQELSPEIVNLNELITNLQKMLGRLIPENIQMKLDLSKNLGNTKVDPGQLEQVIVNLVVNARDAIGLEGGRLKISTQNINLNPSDKIAGIITRKAPYVLIKIKDTGCGMDEKTMQQVYEPFFTTKEVGKGTGLGLSTVFGIVKQHNGYIWVKSKPGRGTTFFIALPLVAEKRGQTDKKTEESDYSGHKEVILVVEDEKPIRILIKRLLTQIGYLVETAANSGEALMMIHEQGLRPHLIVTDVIMPGISGRELLDHLMRHEGFRFKALLISGYSEEILSKKDLLPQGISFMKKPFTGEELAKSVFEALHGPEPVTSSFS